MLKSFEFFELILDTIENNIVVIDKSGYIQYTNLSWKNFGINNDCKVLSNNWSSINYLNVCDESTGKGDSFGSSAAKGIRKVIDENEASFHFEYPCHSKKEKRWFLMSVTPFILDEKSFYVISHQNITRRKLAEEKALKLSLLDGLTGISNRRAFDMFLKDEWQRCLRLSKPITLAILDIDYFKLLNDTYGHQSGDECLKKIGMVLKKYARRPTDICARYGGEEFSLVFGDTSNSDALLIIEEFQKEIQKLKIPNENSKISSYLTISIGLMTMHPKKEINFLELIKRADKLLYKAKENGRNQVVCELE